MLIMAGTAGNPSSSDAQQVGCGQQSPLGEFNIVAATTIWIKHDSAALIKSEQHPDAAGTTPLSCLSSERTRWRLQMVCATTDTGLQSVTGRVGKSLSNTVTVYREHYEYQNKKLRG